MLVRMRHFMLPLLTLALLTASGTGAAQTVIHHCVGADGTPIFTDRTCASLGALSAKHATHPLRPRATRGARHCPLDRQALRMRVVAAFRRHNANALAGLMLWRGYGAAAADTIVQQLAQLMHAPFLGLAGFDTTGPPAAPATASLPAWWPPPLLPAHTASVTTPANTNTLDVRLGHPAPPLVQFEVTRRDGCVWLEPPLIAGTSQP